MKKKLAIVLDSSCGIQSFKGHIKNDNVYFVPLIITTQDGKNYNDDESLTLEKFEDMLINNERLLTSQSNPGVVLKLWETLLEEYDEIINLPISSGLSGQYQTMKMLSKDFDGRVHVVNTNGISLLQQYIAKWTQQLSDEGLNAEEIVKKVDKECESINGFIIVQDLKRLVAGGRITPAVAMLAKLLKICPILKWNGKIDKFGKARTWKKAVNETIDQLKKDNVKKVEIGWSLSNTSDSDYILKQLKDAGIEIGTVVYIPYVLSAHIGLEVFAFMCDMKEKI
ncbi:hypothetical protein STIUS_v1c05600 [Spiroplasma sp. TIUS-1]|uniref:DegV family protein n=1 Tax=Spiroplasma sp. TIUS-1 TaxID=216963 RepID=UPI0013990A8A|nr:DegV family protein [Spiroplasma sp. TIUS-1]QHX36114.1 hypothetical protein STIUS_v1c05600 [Spiroplasma sp. TIUS-1]